MLRCAVAALLLSAAAGLSVTRTTHVADHVANVAADPLSAAKHEVVELQARANAAKMRAAALKANVAANVATNVKLMAPESAKVDPWAMLTAKHEMAVPAPVAPSSELAAQPVTAQPAAAGEAPQMAPMTVNMMSVPREPRTPGYGPEKPEPESPTEELLKDQERAKTCLLYTSPSPRD